jgi:hypothetical protein
MKALLILIPLALESFVTFPTQAAYQAPAQNYQQSGWVR